MCSVVPLYFIRETRRTKNWYECPGGGSYACITSEWRNGVGERANKSGQKIMCVWHVCKKHRFLDFVFPEKKEEKTNIFYRFVSVATG